MSMANWWTVEGFENWGALSPYWDVIEHFEFLRPAGTIQVIVIPEDSVQQMDLFHPILSKVLNQIRPSIATLGPHFAGWCPDQDAQCY